MITASGLVWALNTNVPNLMVAAILAGLFLRSSLVILRRAFDVLRLDDTPAHAASPLGVQDHLAFLDRGLQLTGSRLGTPLGYMELKRES